MKPVKGRVGYSMEEARSIKEMDTYPEISSHIVSEIWDCVEDSLGLETITWIRCNNGWIRSMR